MATWLSLIPYGGLIAFADSYEGCLAATVKRVLAVPDLRASIATKWPAGASSRVLSCLKRCRVVVGISDGERFISRRLIPGEIMPNVGRQLDRAMRQAKRIMKAATKGSNPFRILQL